MSSETARCATEYRGTVLGVSMARLDGGSAFHGDRQVGSKGVFFSSLIALHLSRRSSPCRSQPR